jgi:uncharacterized membrane protein YphA (DoxX/SURF4 family)
VPVAAWLALLARLALAGVWLYAGASKIGDLAASGRAVAAYRLLPHDVAVAVGAALPFVELALGALLLIGFATRVSASVSAGLLTVFSFGIASAWARGLRIDCGCFGGGGELAAGRSPTYGWELARDLALIAVAVFLAVRPGTPFSLDSRLSVDIGGGQK